MPASGDLPCASKHAPDGPFPPRPAPLAPLAAGPAYTHANARNARNAHAGAGVTIYALDSGVFAQHDEFQSWGTAPAAGSGAATAGRASYGCGLDDSVRDVCALVLH